MRPGLSVPASLEGQTKIRPSFGPGCPPCGAIPPGTRRRPQRKLVEQRSGKQTLEIGSFCEFNWMVERMTSAFDLCQSSPGLSGGLVNAIEKSLGIDTAGAGGLHQYPTWV